MISSFYQYHSGCVFYYSRIARKAEAGRGGILLLLSWLFYGNKNTARTVLVQLKFLAFINIVLAVPIFS